MITLLRVFLSYCEIVGGREAQPHSRPYMAYLSLWCGHKSSFCRGFLVSENFVLMAAHCNGELGTHSLGNWEHNEQRIPVVTTNNNIMLLQYLQLNGYVRGIPLPLPHQRMRPGTVCSVAGWGRTSAHNQLTSATLQETDVVVMQDAECPRDPDGIYHNYNASTMISFQVNLLPSTQGIVSWGSEDGTPPAVYIRVSTYIPWIWATMRRLQQGASGS
uniref:Peptidase S1 domain-containing protein n=1 Tax=Chelonoidis abingdonii TaxID=106734 RepID=A0A8C0GWH1_CHEAB